jgi:hypothetical protein
VFHALVANPAGKIDIEMLGLSSPVRGRRPREQATESRGLIAAKKPAIDRHLEWSPLPFFPQAKPHNLHTFDFADGISVCSADGELRSRREPQRVCCTQVCSG